MEKENNMEKKLILLVCMMTLMAFAIAAPGAFAKPEYYAQCQGCHGGGDPAEPKNNAPSNGATCMGCHEHGGSNITATPDRTEYAPGDTIMVTLDTTRNRGGWIRAKLFDKAAPSANDVAINIASNPCQNCSVGVGGVDGITTEYPATLIASAPSAPGTYTWSASWYGNPGGSSYGAHQDVYAQFTFNVVAPDANNPPMANAAGPYNGTVNEPVAFDGSGSSDSDSTIVAYEWDFGDGHTGSGEMTTHTYASDGRFTVTLTVTDDSGDTGTDTTTATIGLGNQAPTADAKSPYNGTVNEPLAFDGSGSSDPDGSIVAYDWDFGDGNTASGPTPTQSYVAGGTYNVTLTVTDNLGAQDSDMATATIGLGNQAPIADANNPYNGTANEPIEFDGSDSSDPDGTIVAYDWDFGDGDTGTGPTPSHTYTTDGTYNVTLTVTDDAGDTGTDTTTATIGPGNQSPIADANNPYSGTVNEPVQFDGSHSSDPDGSIVAYDWDFGDGNTGTGEMTTHTYAYDGSFTVTLTVTDNMGASDSTSRTATIGLGNLPPIADANNPYNGTVNEPVQFNGSYSSDPDGTIVAYDWDFGDDSTGTGPTPSHTYISEGIYNVTLTVTDDMGASDSTTRTATIGQATQPPADNPGEDSDEAEEEGKDDDDEVDDDEDKYESDDDESEKRYDRKKRNDRKRRYKHERRYDRDDD